MRMPRLPLDYAGPMKANWHLPWFLPLSLLLDLAVVPWDIAFGLFFGLQRMGQPVDLVKDSLISVWLSLPAPAAVFFAIRECRRSRRSRRRPAAIIISVVAGLLGAVLILWMCSGWYSEVWQNRAGGWDYL
jgi:hypothetical protein